MARSIDRERTVRRRSATLSAALLALAACSAPERGRSGPLWIAHRGNSAFAPENTLAAVRSALALDPPPDFVEIDVRASADGVLVVLHDATLQRTTTGVGELAELSFAEVRRHSAGYPDAFGDAFAEERVPRLDEVLDAVAGSPVGVMIEVKEQRLGGLVARLVEQRGETRKHLIASFLPGVCLAAQLAVPNVRTLYLTRDALPEEVELAVRIQAAVFGADHAGLSPAATTRAQARDLGVWAWTVNDPERAAELIAFGVDGIITDRPGELRARGRTAAGE